VKPAAAVPTNDDSLLKSPKEAIERMKSTVSKKASAIKKSITD
jgi:hypothetical protein